VVSTKMNEERGTSCVWFDTERLVCSLCVVLDKSATQSDLLA
jgi:hypothetical protein